MQDEILICTVGATGQWSFNKEEMLNGLDPVDMRPDRTHAGHGQLRSPTE